jgi:hypothetical protein
MIFKEDKKLGRRRLPIKTTLVYYSYTLGAKRMQVKRHRFVKRSAFNIHTADRKFRPVPIKDIGKLQMNDDTFYIFSYPDKKEQAINKIKRAVKRLKIKMMAFVKSIPDF